MSSCQEVHPEFCSEVTWEKLGWPLFWWPLIVLAIIAIVLMPMLMILGKIFVKLKIGNYRIRTLVGVASHPKSGDTLFVVTFCLVEIIASFKFAVGWIVHSYTRKVTKAEADLEVAECIIFMVIWLINAARHSFRMSYAFVPSSLIAILCCVPVFVRAGENSDAQWFSWGYLRIYNALRAFDILQQREILMDLTSLQEKLLLTMMEFIVLIVICSGTMFNLEILGPVGGLTDSFVTTPMGDISFFQMSYWTFTTISTVGYGDFSPQTVLSRLFIIVVILSGTLFFGIKTSGLIDEFHKESSGRGRYINVKSLLLDLRDKRQHMIIVGGGVSAVSPMLKPLFDELLSPEANETRIGWPDVSLMSPQPKPPALASMLQELPREAKKRVQYFVGDPMKYEDMERLRMGDETTGLVVVLTNLHAADADQEDSDNIMRTLAITQAFPEVNLRLMLLRPKNKARAVHVGIPPNRCFSINELKSNLFALSCFCRGWATLITHFLSFKGASTGPDLTKDVFSMFSTRKDADTDAEPWVAEYMSGQDTHIKGFHVADRYHNMSFINFCKETAPANITPFAVQIQGNIKLLPQKHVLKSDDVVFALSCSNTALDKFRDDREWRSTFTKNQEEESNRTQLFMQEERSHLEKFKDRLLHKQSTRAVMPTLSFKSNSSSASLGSIVKSISAQSYDDVFVEENAELVEQISSEGCHYILAVLSSNNGFQQVSTFLHAARREQLDFHVPIIVLMHASKLDNKALLAVTHGYDGVAIQFLDERVTIHDIEEAGLIRARCVVLLAGTATQSQASDKDYDLVDSHGVTLLASIEFELKRLLKAKEVEEAIPVILELHSVDSVRCMSKYPVVESLNPRANSERKLYSSKFVDHPRFASGGIFSLDCLGTLLAHAYYTPGIVELLDALVVSPRVQPWQVPIPAEFRGKTYLELSMYYLDREDPAVLMGLYRQCWEGAGFGASYVFTNPPPSTVLKEGDYTILLASLQFGRECFANDMLPCVKGCKVSFKQGPHESI